MPRPSGERNQYHHFIPRFILRKFSTGEQPKKAQRKGPSNKGADPFIHDPIYCYSISTGTLTINSLGHSYGTNNLYKNVKSQKDVYLVEKKLSILEGQAAVAISGIHKLVGSKNREMEEGGATSGSAVFRIQRKSLNYLLKFLFIMYYRKDGYQAVHFQEDRPENLPIAAWIRNFRRKKDLDPSEVWLHILEYYLDTPHHELVEEGRIVFEKLKAAGGMEALGVRGVNPNLEKLETLGYHGEATNFFLSIWEAAEGEEFVITDNSFGIVEGMPLSSMGGTPFTFHRFYVISPKVALVLCSIPLRPDFPLDAMPEVQRMYRQSMLKGAPHKTPRATKNGQLVDRGDQGERYQEDMMEYELSTLSVELTHKVNAIILGNVKPTGIVTFHTPSVMLQTLETFSKDRDFNNQQLYGPLVTEILVKTGGSSEFSFTPNPNPTSQSPWIPPSRTRPSFYNMTFTIYTKLKETNDPLIQTFKMAENKLLQQVAVKIAQTPHDINPRSARLRQHLESYEAFPMFHSISRFLKGFLKLDLPVLFPEAAIISFLDWTLKNRRLMLEIIEKCLSLPLMEWVFDEAD